MILFANKADLSESEVHALIEIIKAVGALIVFIFVMIRRKKRLKKEEADKKKVEELEKKLKKYEDNSKQ